MSRAEKLQEKQRLLRDFLKVHNGCSISEICKYFKISNTQLNHITYNMHDIYEEGKGKICLIVKEK